MPLINGKVELRYKWTKYCILAEAGADSVNANSNNIIFTIKDTKVYVPVVKLSAKDNQKLTKPVSKDFIDHCIWMNIKQKMKTKRKKRIYFLESNFVGVNRLFVLVYSNPDVNSKKLKTRRSYLPNEIIKN